ncbi:MAG: CusA/CzcA family heavy metal efflux RND transporter [Spirochaetae bacterium HGW-Spirochaetae-5]|nr:MAG: CusA/CzcA family heavy metal efflux RND transporter [Spirochaetae bacterium HGW-Spirochaetae-5]
MIRKIIYFSAHNRMLVIMLVVAALGYSIYAMRNIPLDAIPDLSDTQVIVYTKWDRSPDLIEDQVTYPIISALLGAPKVKAIRGFSDFGFSYVYVIFQDGTDIYWARSRVLEYLSKIQGSLPPDVKTELGPDATGVGWIFQYALVDKSGKHDLGSLRAFQDWNLKYALQSVPGVAEVATIGGFEKQYQVIVDPNRLHSYNLSLMDVMEAVKKNNNEAGGRLIEWSGKEYMVRAKGYVKNPDDLRKVVLKAVGGTPVLLENVATITFGPQIRRGLAELNGEGDVVGGIIVMRHGENALNVIENIKLKIEDIKQSLPEGVDILPVYDRSNLIKDSIENLKGSLIAETIVVSLVILFFLWHFPSAMVPIITIPISVALAFIPMYYFGISSNIMSLAGIAISIGVLVDGAIVEVENAYKKIEHWMANGREGDFHEVRLEALMEVGPSVFFSLLVIAVSFLPVFTLVDQEGRLFTPLAWTKTLTIALAAFLAVTLDPAVRMLFSRVDPFNIKPKWLSNAADTFFVGRYYPEEKHPVSKVLFKLYDKPCRWVLDHPKRTIAAAAAVVILSMPVYFKLGSEFMPPLNEGTVLYMPTTMPGLSVTEARNLLLMQDKILKTFPEVETVFGKAGRAETSTDPAPFSMMETTIQLKPKDEWREKHRWYSSWAPSPLKSLLRRVWPDRISYEELITLMDQAVQIPGNSNAWTMPIKGRIDMLTTGIRTPIGIKIFGSDLMEIQNLGAEIESALKDIKGTRSVFSERVSGGFYVDFIPRREALARYGLSIDDFQAVIMGAIGGDTVSSTIEGRERYSINVRYPRELRTDVDALGRVIITTNSGVQVHVREVADIKLNYGPSMIRDENGRLAGYVYVDIADRDIGSYVEEAKRRVRENIKLPAGYTLTWSGQYENMERVKERLKLVIPVTVILIFVLLYLNTKSAFKAGLVMLAVPFSAVGAVWLMFILDYNVSIAAWVGMIALMGLDAETGVFMLRPKIMTVMATTMGLMPIMWSIGTGADVMKRIAAPMVGGLFTSFIMELLVYPAIYLLWKKKTLGRD